MCFLFLELQFPLAGDIVGRGEWPDDMIDSMRVCVDVSCVFLGVSEKVLASSIALGFNEDSFRGEPPKGILEIGVHKKKSSSLSSSLQMLLTSDSS